MAYPRGTVLTVLVMLSGLVSAIPMAGTGGASSQAFVGTITIVADGSPGPIGPYPYAAPSFINAPLLDGPITVDAHYRYYADLARMVPTAANGGMRIVNGDEVVTVHLKPGQRWSDGSPITGADYIGSLLLDAAPNAPHYGDCLGILTAATASPSTLVLTFAGAYADALDGCIPSPLPIEYFQRKYGAPLPAPLTASFDTRAVAALYASPSYRGSTLQRLIDKWGQDPYVSPNDLYSGPYKPVRYVQDRLEALAANPYYSALPPTQGHPRPARILFVIRATRDLLTAATGAATTYDLAGPLSVAAAEPDVQSTLARAGYKAIPVLVNTVEHLELNLANPALSDKRVRQALYYALDKVAYIKATVLPGMTPAEERAILQASPVPSDLANWSINGALPSNPYDPAKARALLAAAGYATRSTGAGKQLHFDFYTTELPERERSARTLQRLWAPFGITLRIRYAPVGGPHGLLASYNDGGILARRRFDIAEFALGGFTEPEYLLQWFDPNQVPSEKQPNGSNYIGAQNVRLLEYLSQAQRANDMPLRQRLYDQAQRLIVDNSYWIPLFAPYYFIGVRPTLSGFIPAPQSPYGNAFEWYRNDTRKP